VPLMLLLVRICQKTQHWFPAEDSPAATAPAAEPAPR
jgi:hypothetical protein